MKKELLIEKMNELLATYQLHYQNLRALHWNVKGSNFFELHVKYEELYTRTLLIIDDLAERILTYDTVPAHTFQHYITLSKISENALITDGNQGMQYIVDAQTTLIELEKVILKLSDELDDDGANSMMSDLILEKEKNNWMFKAWLNK